MRESGELLEKMGHDAYAELTGLEVVKAGPGAAEVKMPVSPGVLNGHGNVHGGALFTLADYTAAVASNMLGEPTMACNGSISYLRAVRDGHVVARARTVKAGRRMKFMIVEMFDAEEKLVAIFQGSAINVVRKNGPADAAS